jgi:parvulin-like peptidyl-prolyl isomerase
MSKKPILPEALPKHHFQKKQLARWQREQKFQRIIMYAGSALVVAIVLFVGISYFMAEVKPGSDKALTVDNVSYDLNYYSKMLAFYSSRIPNESAMTLTAYATQGIQSGQMIKKGAEKLGFKVDQDEVIKTLGDLKLPNDGPYVNIATTQLLYDKLRNDYFEKQVPVSTEQVNVEAMFLESAKSAEVVRNKLLAGDNFTAIAQNESLDARTKSVGGALGWVPKGSGAIIMGNPKVEEAAFTLDKGQISTPIFDAIQKPVGYWIIQVTDVEKIGELIRAKASGMLLSSEEEAQKVRSQALAGDNFTQLIEAYSQDLKTKENDGDLGWSNEGMTPLLQDVAVKLQKGEVSQPVKDDASPTLGGFWLVRALDREKDRAIEASLRQQMVEKAFSDWLQDLTSTSQLENLLDSDKLEWVIKHMPKLKVS